MLIQTVIDNIKEYHKGVFEGKQIDEQTTRDKVLYGNPHQECTGIITTCWASVDVIREAAKRGANLIIAHEALFWNHGDHTDWLQEENNQSFLAKKKLLDEAGIVWRINWAGRNILQRIFIIHCISQYQKQQSKSLRIF